MRDQWCSSKTVTFLSIFNHMIETRERRGGRSPDTIARPSRQRGSPLERGYSPSPSPSAAAIVIFTNASSKLVSISKNRRNLQRARVLRGQVDRTPGVGIGDRSLTHLLGTHFPTDGPLERMEVAEHAEERREVVVIDSGEHLGIDSRSTAQDEFIKPSKN